MPTLRQSTAWTVSEDSLIVGTTSEAVSTGDFAAGDSTSELVFDASGGSLKLKRTSGAFLTLGSFSELLTIDAAASTMTTATIPGDAMIFAVSVYVVVEIPAAIVFTPSTELTGQLFANSGSVSAAAGSSDLGNSTCPQAAQTSSAQRVVITPLVTPSSNAGRVRIVAWWMVPTAPTS